MGSPHIIKKCSSCQTRKSVREFYRNRNGYDAYCRECRRIKDASRPPVKRAPGYAREYKLMRNYGLTQADYNRMFAEQSGGCKICGVEETRVLRGRLTSLVVDHNHVTGKIRGLLCHKCNTALHYIEDEQFMLLARQYLREQDGYEFIEESKL